MGVGIAKNEIEVGIVKLAYKTSQHRIGLGVRRTSVFLLYSFILVTGSSYPGTWKP